MLTKQQAKTIRSALKAAQIEANLREDDGERERIDFAVDGIDVVLDMHADADIADPDMASEEQTREAVTEALFRVLPQYRIVRYETQAFERGPLSVSQIDLRLEWAEE